MTKKTKKTTKSESKKTKLAKAPASQELSEKDLEHVAGGAVDAFLKIDLQSVTVSGVTSGAVGGTFYKEYKE
jgi:hypothetical protein